jgi:hypothetical protein
LPVVREGTVKHYLRCELVVNATQKNERKRGMENGRRIIILGIAKEDPS